MYTVTYEHIEEHIVPGKRRLGRHVEHDSRSVAYVADKASVLVNVNHNLLGLPLDQGDIGQCTADALTGAGNWDRLNRLHPREQADATLLYERETRDEGQPYPPNDPGGSGLAVCKAGMEINWLRGYRHAFSLNDALGALMIRPVITGVDWYDSFDAPDRNGLIEITPNASVRGGHEFVVFGVDVVRKLVWCYNSWGPNYSVFGRFSMSFNTWGTLLDQQGDVTVPYWKL